MPALGVVLLAALDLTVAAPVLPAIISDLGINTVDADRYAWILLAYLVAYTVTVPISGRLSDALGRVPIFTSALLLFALGSIVTAVAGDLATIVTGRALQGLGGGAMLPVSMALVADATPQRSRAAALGLVAAVDTFGWVLGPIWGSLIDAIFGSWRLIFWLNLPLALIAGVVMLLRRPPEPRERQSTIPNPLSIALLAIMLTAFTIGLSAGGEASSTGSATLGGSGNPLAPYRWWLVGLGFVSLIGFFLNERRSANPLIPRELLTQVRFRASAFANVFIGAAMIIAMVNAPLVVTLIASSDVQALYSALLLGSFTLTMAAGAIIGGRVLESLSPRQVTSAGVVIAAVGFGIIGLTWGAELELGVQIATIAVAGLGLGVVIAPISDEAIGVAKAIDYGLASGMVLLARLVGMTIGLAIMTRYSVARIDSLVSELPPMSPQPGESSTDFFARQQEILESKVIPITVDVINETFFLAAAFCLASLLIVHWLSNQRGR